MLDILISLKKITVQVVFNLKLEYFGLLWALGLLQPCT